MFKPEGIPDELKQFPQWICWQFEAVPGKPKPGKIPYSPITNYKASSTDPSTWSTYEKALAAKKRYGYDGLSFALSKEDPYIFIDLDDPKKDKELKEQHLDILKAFKSYAEVSVGGQGAHIICKGKIPRVIKKKSLELEVYAHARFVTMSGQLLRDSGIFEEQEALDTLFFKVFGTDIDYGAKAVDLDELNHDQWLNDDEVILRAKNSVSGEKFEALFHKGHDDYGQSNSEADLALMNILSTHTQNLEQCKRLFLKSALGKRPKITQHKSYMNGLLLKAFEKVSPPVDITGLQKGFESFLAYKLDVLDKPAVELVAQPQVKQKAYKAWDKLEEMYIPPGLLGEMMRFGYECCPRPMAESALLGSLCTLCGIAGRSFNVSGEGLNMYVALLCGTGAGKEGVKKIHDKYMSAIMLGDNENGPMPAAERYKGPEEFASGPAVRNYLSKVSPGFSVIMGEVGVLMSKLASGNASEHSLSFRRLLLMLFSRSGEGSKLGVSAYSNNKNCMDEVDAPCMSVFGDSTSAAFFENLTEMSISDGLLPRFWFVETTRPIPPVNKGFQKKVIPTKLLRKLQDLTEFALQLEEPTGKQRQRSVMHVELDAEADEYSDAIDARIRTMLGSSEKQTVKDLYNRVHLKTLKLAALVAVGVNWDEPIITLDVLEWSYDMVERDVRSMLEKFEKGIAGRTNSDYQKIMDAEIFIKQFLNFTVDELVQRDYDPLFQKSAIIPHQYLYKGLYRVKSFAEDKMGAANAVKNILRTLEDCGDIRTINKSQILHKFNVNQQAYAILNYAKYTKKDQA